MINYNPSDFQLNGAAIVAAWLVAVIFLVVLTVMLPISTQVGQTIYEVLTAGI